MDSLTLLVLHTLATYAMFGLIWMVQWVHYPAFLYADRERFAEFAKFHVDRISFLVVPLMFLELFTGVGLCLIPPAGLPWSWWGAGLGMIGVIWMVTALVSVPMHRRLLQGFDEKSVRHLIRWNWIRTLLWTVRAVGLSWVLWEMLKAEG